MSYTAPTNVDVHALAKEKGAVIVDLRSDTLTKPSTAMRRAMFETEVGDDVYGEDPAVNELERKCANMVGKEAALFISSGTMGNLIATMVHCRDRGCEAYCGEDSHVVLHEQGGAAQIAGVTICPIPNEDDGTFSLETLSSKIRKEHYAEPLSRLVIVENPINGVTIAESWLEELKKFAAKHRLKLHMDGARLWNAVVSSGVSAEKIVAGFDSVTFCLSKGLGAPAGSVICGDREFVAQARRCRKVLGGGMRQSGVLAAAGLVALEETIPMLKRDHERTWKMAMEIEKANSKICQTFDKQRMQSNMLFLKVDPTYNARNFVRRLSEIRDDPEDPRVIVRGIAVSDTKVRLVFHRDINDDLLDAAIRKILHVLKE